MWHLTTIKTPSPRRENGGCTLQRFFDKHVQEANIMFVLCWIVRDPEKTSGGMFMFGFTSQPFDPSSCAFALREPCNEGGGGRVLSKQVAVCVLCCWGCRKEQVVSWLSRDCGTCVKREAFSPSGSCR